MNATGGTHAVAGVAVVVADHKVGKPDKMTPHHVTFLARPESYAAPPNNDAIGVIAVSQTTANQYQVPVWRFFLLGAVSNFVAVFRVMTHSLKCACHLCNMIGVAVPSRKLCCSTKATDISTRTPPPPTKLAIAHGICNSWCTELWLCAFWVGAIIIQRNLASARSWSHHLRHI